MKCFISIKSLIATIQVAISCCNKFSDYGHLPTVLFFICIFSSRFSVQPRVNFPYSPRNVFVRFAAERLVFIENNFFQMQCSEFPIVDTEHVSFVCKGKFEARKLLKKNTTINKNKT